MLRMRSCLTAVLLLLTVSSSNAQIDTHWPVLAIDLDGSTECGQAPLVCEGASSIPGPGSFDAFVYLESDASLDVAECALGVTWPDDWSVTAELCNGVVIEGSLLDLQSGIRVLFTPCVPWDTAFLRLSVNASSVGRLQLTSGPQGDFGSSRCGGDFEDYFVGPHDRKAYVDVGNVCGGVPLNDPCDYCALHWGIYQPTASLDPPSWDVEVPQSGTETLAVTLTNGGDCQMLPECGGGTQNCVASGPTSNADWLTFSFVEGAWEARVDATDLPEGTYSAGVEIEAFSCCAPVCWPVELTVQGPVHLDRSTWERVKAGYR